MLQLLYSVSIYHVWYGFAYCLALTCNKPMSLGVSKVSRRQQSPVPVPCCTATCLPVSSRLGWMDGWMRYRKIFFFTIRLHHLPLLWYQASNPNEEKSTLLAEALPSTRAWSTIWSRVISRYVWTSFNIDYKEVNGFTITLFGPSGMVVGLLTIRIRLS